MLLSTNIVVYAAPQSVHVKGKNQDENTGNLISTLQTK